MSNLSDFLPLVGGSDIFRIARTSNISLSKDEKGALIDITSGTFTQTFDACATLGDGWFVYLKNSGTGDITLDPSGSETIDGVTSYIMYPGEVRLIQCDGLALRSVVLNSFYKVFESSGNFVKPPGYKFIEGLLWAGGAGGSVNGKPGGGGGACCPFLIPQNLLSTITSVDIGSGGLGATSSSPTGNTDGGNSTFAGFVTAFGGSRLGAGGGIFGTSINGLIGGDPVLSQGTGSTRLHNNVYGGGSMGTSDSQYAAGTSIYGGASAGGDSAPNSSAASGGKSLFGGGGGGTGVTSGRFGAGGTSTFGGNGGGGSDFGNGQDGQAPGGGGGSTVAGSFGGAGARGELRIWGII